MSQSKTESEMTRELDGALKAANVTVIPIVGGMGMSGWPDRYYAHELFRGWVEMKVPPNDLSDLQESRCHMLTQRGDVVLIGRFRLDEHTRMRHLSLTAYAIDGDEAIHEVRWARKHLAQRPAAVGELFVMAAMNAIEKVLRGDGTAKNKWGRTYDRAKLCRAGSLVLNRKKRR